MAYSNPYDNRNFKSTSDANMVLFIFFLPIILIVFLATISYSIRIYIVIGITLLAIKLCKLIKNRLKNKGE
jgi:hypothetical protein